MKRLNETFLNKLVTNVINETLEEKADNLVSRINKEMTEKTKSGRKKIRMTDDEIDKLMSQTISESKDCPECGCELTEGNCSECGYKMESLYKKTKPFGKKRQSFDYVEQNVNEETHNEGVEITIEKSDRGRYDVEYVKTKDGFSIDLTGTLIPYNTGRSKEYKFEPNWFSDDISESYYDIHWEGIEDEILDKFYGLNKKNMGRLSEESNYDDDMFGDKMSETCKYHLDRFGPDDEMTIRFCKVDEGLKGNQKKLDKNKNNKIDSEDFKLLRKSKKRETDEQWGTVARLAVPIATSYISSKLSETDEEVEEGNAFTGALSKAKKEGKDNFTVDGKKYKVEESIKLTENELVDLIEKIINEQKNTKLKNFGKPKGLTKYEEVHKVDGRNNDEYIKSVSEKMKKYLKHGSKGEYETNPESFPKGNGELGEMSKKAYKASSAVEDYVDNFTAAGLENLTYDEIHPNEKKMDKHIEGSSETGNNPKWANAVDTGVNKKRNKIRKDNLLGAIKRQAYNKSPQPVVSDEAGETTTKNTMNINFNKGSGKKANKILSQLESIEPEKNETLNEEFDRMRGLITYDRKTQ